LNSAEGSLVAPVPKVQGRNQVEARRVVNDAYPFACCAVCGLQIAACLQAAHLDHDAGNNMPGGLARLCATHHGMYDAGLYPLEAIRLLQGHWQTNQDTTNHKARMKDAGAKAALTRKRGVAARKAVATRQTNAKARNSSKSRGRRLSDAGMASPAQLQ